MDTLKNKISITLEYEIIETFDGNQTVIFKHPDLKGDLHFSASSSGLVDLQLQALDTDKSKYNSNFENLVENVKNLSKEVTKFSRRSE